MCTEMLIQLTLAQADSVRSKPTPYAAIEPAVLTDGSFILGEEVLTDPAHIAKRATLLTFPRITEASIAGKTRVSGKAAAEGK